jgi:hypothetical protein
MTLQVVIEGATKEDLVASLRQLAETISQMDVEQIQMQAGRMLGREDKEYGSTN